MNFDAAFRRYSTPLISLFIESSGTVTGRRGERQWPA